MRPPVWAGLLLGIVTSSLATDTLAQGAPCRSDAHQLPTPLVGAWHEFTVTPAGLVFEGELKSSLEASGCAFTQTFVSTDSTFTFRSLGYVDQERDAWVEHFVLSDGRTAAYQWERDGSDILLNRTEPVAGRFRLRITDIQADSYTVVEERRATDSDEWRQGERTLTRRVSENGGAEPGSSADLGGRVALPATTGAFYALSVRDIGAAVTWYTHHLGFTIESRGGNDERMGALLSRPGAILELGEFVGATARDELRSGLESHEVHGIFKLGFTTTNLDASFAFLEERGVEIFFPIVNSSDGTRTFGIRDMEGNIIQFFEK